MVVLLIKEETLLPLYPYGIAQARTASFTAGRTLTTDDPVNFIFPSILPGKPPGDQLSIGSEFCHNVYIMFTEQSPNFSSAKESPADM